MKHFIITLIMALISCLSCKAQNPILALDDPDDFINGAYYKDLNNELDKFVGTWKQENGNTTLTIMLRKVEQRYNGEWYEDLLVGEYRYVVNGVEVFNSLPRLNHPFVNDAQHYIDGNIILKKMQKPSCSDCDISERRLLLFFSDPERNYLGNSLAIRYVNDNGIEKLEAKLISDGAFVEPYVGAPQEPRVPYGSYTLVKQ